MPEHLQCPNCGTVVEISVPEETLGQITANSGPLASPSAIADEVLDGMLPPIPAAFLHSAVTESVRIRQRRSTRAREKTLLTIDRDWNRDMAARTALLSLPMSLGDGTRVTWGQATWEQWEQRARVLDHIEHRVLQGVRQGQAVVAWAMACRELNPEATCLNDVTVLPAPPALAPATEDGHVVDSTATETKALTAKAPRVRSPRKPRKMR